MTFVKPGQGFYGNVFSINQQQGKAYSFHLQQDHSCRNTVYLNVLFLGQNDPNTRSMEGHPVLPALAQLQIYIKIDKERAVLRVGHLW